MFLALKTQFDGLYGQDSFAYYDFAIQLLDFARSGSAPGPFYWPLGYPLLLSVGFAVFGTSANTGQLLSILMGALLPALVFILARQVNIGYSGALTAGMTMLVCGQALQSSMVLMADIPALFWATTSAIALFRYLDKQKRSWLAFASAALALAADSRWLYLALALPWSLAVLIHWKRQRSRQQAASDAAVVLLAGLLILMPQFVYDRFNPQAGLSHPWVQSWSPTNAARTTFDNVDGHFEYAQPNLLFYARPLYDPVYLSPLMLPFALSGLCTLFWLKRWFATALVVGWLLLPYLFLVGIPYQNIRFPLVSFPAVTLLVGLGIDSLLKLRPRRVRLAAALISAMILLAGWGHGAVQGYALTTTFIQNQQRDKNIVQWANENVPPGAQLYTFGLTLTFQHYTTLDVYELYYETPSTLNQRWRRGEDDYLIINVSNVENQWKDRIPSITYHWLRDARGLIRMGSRDGYTLFRVRG